MKISRWIKVLSCAAVFMFAMSAMAKKVEMGFQIGEVVMAETSTAATKILDWENSPYNNNFKNPRYAVVTVKLLPMRTLNIVDYTLTLGGVTVPCAAITSNMGIFLATSRNMQFIAKDYGRMIFVFDGSKVRGNGKLMPARLNSNLPGIRPISFNVTDLGNKPFTDVKKIPADGLLK